MDMVFFQNRTFGRYVGGMYNQCDTMHLYIVTKTKLKYVVSRSSLRDHLKTKEMKIKKHLQWHHEYQRYDVNFLLFFQPN